MSFILYNCIQWNCIQNKISLNIGILLTSVLMPRLLNNPFASFLINFDFLSPHIAHFDNVIVPLFIAFETCRIMFFVFSPNFDFLLPHIVHFDNIIVLPLVVFETL